MLIELLLLILFAGVPYYLILESIKGVGAKWIFWVSATLMVLGILLVVFDKTPLRMSEDLMLVALFNALLALYKGIKSTNLYRLSYYLLFINAPMGMFFDLRDGTLYMLSLLISLFGLFLVARFYERSYGSANYYAVTGTTLVTPYIGFFLTLYLLSIALYPPLPNALFFLNTIFLGTMDSFWYLVVSTMFFSNFIVGMRAVSRGVLGTPNPHLHYVDIGVGEKIKHTVMMIILALSAIWGFKEVLQ
jgi:hypothetical protein